MTSEQIVCPVCKKVLHSDNLPDRNSVITENILYGGGIRIVDSEVRILCQFKHRYDEKCNSLKEPHELIAVILAQFDNEGRCTSFEIVEILKGGD